MAAGDAPVGHGSLRDTLVHVVGTEDEWMTIDLAGDPGRAPELEARYASERFAGVRAVWEAGAEVRRRFRGWFPRWAEPVHLADRDFDTTVGDVCLHVLLHEVAHHGDITTILSALGAPELAYYFVGHRMSQAGL